MTDLYIQFPSDHLLVSRSQIVAVSYCTRSAGNPRTRRPTPPDIHKRVYTNRACSTLFRDANSGFRPAPSKGIVSEQGLLGQGHRTVVRQPGFEGLVLWQGSGVMHEL